MQSEHKRLLFFTIPKVLALYEILNVDLANSAMKQRRKKKLTCEIGYLFKRDKKTSVDLQNSVSVSDMYINMSIMVYLTTTYCNYIRYNYA